MTYRARPFLAVILLSFAVWLFALHPAPARACSCLQPPPPDEALRHADAVFAGEVTDFRIAEPVDGVTSSDLYEAAFRVTAVWKGPDADRIKVLTADPSQLLCGYRFEPGVRYLVYAYESTVGLETGNCTRTALLDTAGYDLSVIGEGAMPSSVKRNAWLMRGVAAFAVPAAAVLAFGLFRRFRRTGHRGER